MSYIKPDSPDFDLDALRARCAGLSGSAEDEWSIGYQKGDEHIRLYSGIGAVIANAIKRNRAAIVGYRIDEYTHSDSFGVHLLLDPAKCRAPWAILKTDGSGTPLSAEAAARFKR